MTSTDLSCIDVVARALALEQGRTPVGIYVRLSEDKALRAGNEDREEGEQVAEQRRRLHEAAPRFGCVVVREYNDNNTPASDPFIVRRDFEQMLKDLESGEIRGFLFTHSDRVARLEYDAARVNRIFAMFPSYVGRALDGGTDLSTQEGRTTFMVQATMGAYEVANTKRRVSGTNKARAMRGKKHGGPRPFGWNDDRETLHAKEAEDLLKAIRAIPGGKLVGEVRKEWIEAGYTPRANKKSRESGNNWTLQHSTVEARLVNPRNCGYMVYIPQQLHRESSRLWLPDHVLYKDGKPVIGDWEPACTPEEWAACVSAIEARKEANREGNPAHDTSPAYFLTGIARCGECFFPMRATLYTKGTGAYAKYRFRYQCRSSLGGCGGVSRVGPPVDDLVETAFLDDLRKRLKKAEAAKAEVIDTAKNDARLKEIDWEKKQVKNRRDAKRISVIAAMDMIESLEKEEARLVKETRQLQAAKAKTATDTDEEILRRWKDYTTSEKRARLRRSIRAVLIHQVGRGKRFDPAFIEILWTKGE
ncbi:recombinase family protein [Streptantibioticus rubrisoli]|uniref:Recombinase family protein n=1 Tax=Streptantibioticus rubrisoli TaxID=1387313 RepID=A0ABT1PL20_9ACTN|nr:recombinase family protein [Streptantibioticus rubrisoli]MCQ4046056.1 recombinase family protein [Streptantibioticus rubrisoli]